MGSTDEACLPASNQAGGADSR